MNGRVGDPAGSLLYHVGQNLALCYSGNIFGYKGSPVYWEKYGDRFSDSILLSSASEICFEYLSEIMSNPELRSGGRVQSFLNLYRTDPCLLYNDQFIAILLIQSLEMDDAGVYDLYLETLDGLILSMDQVTLHDIGK